VKVAGYPAILNVGNGELVLSPDMSSPQNRFKFTWTSNSLDPQRELVYEWESKIPYGRNIGWLDGTSLVAQIAGDYYLDTPTVVLGREGSYPMYDYENHAIHIQKSLFYTSVIIHEVAHAIHKTYGFVLDQTHGPEFVALYIELLNRYMFIYDDSFAVIDPSNKNRLIILTKTNYRAYITNMAQKIGVSISDDWYSLGSMAYYLDAVV